MNTLQTPGGIDSERFAQCFNRLLAATVSAKDDAMLIRAKLDVYFEALRYRPQWAVEQASRQLIDSETFFPPVARWVDVAQKIETDQSRRELSYPREKVIYCETCSDTGWAPHECKHGQRCGQKLCDRADKTGATYEHFFVSVCPCREHNPNYLRDRAYTRLQAEQRAQKALKKR